MPLGYFLLTDFLLRSTHFSIGAGSFPIISIENRCSENFQHLLKDTGGFQLKLLELIPKMLQLIC